MKNTPHNRKRLISKTLVDIPLLILVCCADSPLANSADPDGLYAQSDCALDGLYAQGDCVRRQAVASLVLCLKEGMSGTLQSLLREIVVDSREASGVRIAALSVLSESSRVDGIMKALEEIALCPSEAPEMRCASLMVFVVHGESLDRKRKSQIVSSLAQCVTEDLTVRVCAISIVPSHSLVRDEAGRDEAIKTLNGVLESSRCAPDVAVSALTMLGHIGMELLLSDGTFQASAAHSAILKTASDPCRGISVRVAALDALESPLLLSMAFKNGDTSVAKVVARLKKMASCEHAPASVRNRDLIIIDRINFLRDAADSPE